MSNISIRVKLPEAPKEYVVKEERIILWDRVLSVVFMGIIALAALYFVLVFDWTSSEPAEKPALETVAAPDAPELNPVTEHAKPNASHVVALKDKAQAKTAELTEAGGANTADVANKATAPSPVTSEPHLTAQQTTDPATRAVAVEKPLDHDRQKAAAAPQTALVVDQNKTAGEQANAVAAVVAKEASRGNAEVNVYSPKVKSALLTREMNNRTPGKALADIVYVTEGELLTVYFYAEFDGLAKQTLHFDWFQNGKRRARVKIRPLEENIGNYSSKYITHRMTGDWSVSVSTAEGEKLASAKFKVAN